MKNPSSLYGVSYLHRPLAGDESGKATRWEDNGIYFSTALAVSKIIEKFNIGRRFLDAGCGRGYVVRHLINKGFDAHGFEYGKETVENAVIKQVVYGDLTEKLPFSDNTFDFILCHGVLSHLTPEYIENGILELKRICKSVLWTNILIKPADMQRHHRTVKPKEFWIPIFEKGGWVNNKEMTDYSIELGYGKSSYGWSNIWTKGEKC